MFRHFCAFSGNQSNSYDDLGVPDNKPPVLTCQEALKEIDRLMESRLSDQEEQNVLLFTNR